MRTIWKLLFLLIPPACLQAQTTTNADSLKRLLQHEKRDTARVNLLLQLGNALFARPDTSLLLNQQALLLARSASFVTGEVRSLNQMANVFRVTGNYPKALSLYLEALQKAEATDDKLNLTRILGNIGVVYSYQGDYPQAVTYMSKALTLAQTTGFQNVILILLLNLGDAYEKSNQLDSAQVYTERAYQMATGQKDVGATATTLNNLGNICSKLGRDTTALAYYRQGIPLLKQSEALDGLCETFLGMARLFQKRGRADSSLYYAKQSLVIAQQVGLTGNVLAASDFLSSYYSARHELDSAFAYQSATIAAKDSLFSQEKQRQIQSLGYEEMVRQQQVRQAKAEAQTQMKFNALLGGLFTLCIIAFLLWRNNRQKQKANKELNRAYTELKATQAQLIQSEKMASLGELTAGIAHEIQNPLNFVNNFSETNIELLEESVQELTDGNYENAKALIIDAKVNEGRINYHGKRADAIVKNMLEHSRTSKGEKQPADLNNLVDEYLRLAYHGFRAKDKSFNVSLQTHFDKSIGKANIVPQDIGRVLLNLFNNAFYAVHEQLKKLGAGYQPIVSVCTKKLQDKIEIRVQDNGMGISKSIQEKIFQPFFTTKPTGEGTGLGLSLSYDIIKAHGGALNVESPEGDGATFMITLPLA